MVFDFIVIAPLLPSHCSFSFVFGCGVSFLVNSSVFLSVIVQQLVVILVLSQEGVFFMFFCVYFVFFVFFVVCLLSVFIFQSLFLLV